nr:Pr6Pr family membrane protein [Blastococcus saxobsidens]
MVDPEDASLGVVERVVRFFSYFTVQSNLLVLAAVLPLVRDADHDGRWWRVVRLASLLGITITGIVYAVVLAPLYDPEGVNAWTNAGEHYVSPVMTVLGWLLFGPRPRITSGVVARALLWPVAWIAWILAQGTVTDWYPYDFMDVAAQGYAIALRNLAFVVLLALAFLLLFRFVDRRLAATGAPERVGDGGRGAAALR